jgi:acyl-CoA thioester hydrolase
MSPTTFVGVVYPNQIDHMGHANVQYYASVFDQATWAFLSEFGITPEYMKANHRGMAAVSQRTKYILELFSGDIVEIETELLGVTERTIRFIHTMRRRPQMDTIATSQLVGVHFDTEIHKSCPLPEEIKERLARHAQRIELLIFARFHSREGKEDAVAAALREELEASHAEPGCLEHHACRSTRDPRLFFIHSRWVDEAAFNAHISLPHTLRFVGLIEPLIDHALDVNRTRRL